MMRIIMRGFSTIKSKRRNNMAVFPVSSNFEGDFVIQLVPVDTGNSMDEVAAACAVHSINRRVAPRPPGVPQVFAR